jgi:two-component system, NtrC family, sensor kinase
MTMTALTSQSSEPGNSHTVPLPPLGVASLADEDRRLLADAERALDDRPRITMSLRIGISMLLCFLLVAGVVVASMVLVSRVGTLQEFLDKASTYALEVENTRRYEKNYLLYGTGLDDALTQAQAAHNQLRSIKASMVEVTGPQGFERMEENLEQYDRSLERLAELARQPSATSQDLRNQELRTLVEKDLRRRGAQLIADATDLLERERLRLRTAIRTSWIVAASSLLFIMLAMALVTYTLTRQVSNPLRRFAGYTERIAAGDFSPILPARRYRDEFSRLAVAINRMLFRLKDREAQLARHSRMAAVGTLTAGIAHELNNPLNNISLNAEALHEGLSNYTDDQKLKMLADIVSQVERASATVRNLLDFTRVEKPVVVSLSVENVVREARRLVANEAEINRVEFNLALPSDLPKVQGNPRDLQQVFLNLFLNAIQAMPNGGVLTVRGKTTGDRAIEIEVTDTGVGIPEENIGSVFDPFFTTKEVGAGTGLGLAVSYGIVEKHNGTITVRSKLGEGTTFVVRLPISSIEGGVGASLSSHRG